MLSGFTRLIIVAIPNPRKRPVASTAATALASPRRAQAIKSSTVNEPRSASFRCFGLRLDKFHPKYRDRVARFEVYASQHPLFPHMHKGPSRFSGCVQTPPRYDRARAAVLRLRPLPL